MATKHQINIRPETVRNLLLIITAALLVIHLVLQFAYHVQGIEALSTLRGRFDVDNEISIPTWFSQIVLLLPATLGLIIFKLNKSRERIYWLLLSVLFIFLSADEGAMLHEAFITKFREWTVSPETTGLGSHTWLIPVGVALLLLLIPFVKFISHLPKRTVVLLSIGLGVYVFGAIVYETIGLIHVPPGFWYEGLNVAIEEGLEMTGAILTAYAVHDYLARTHKQITLDL